MNLATIRIILVATTHPGNIGSTARAMKTMGLEKLYLVSPRSFPDIKAYELAAGAQDILDNAIVVETLDEALMGCQLVMATSARPRGLALSGLTPAECATFIQSTADDVQIAIVFGREHAGLTNEELLKCHFHVNIPSNPEYSSLNLAQAVQIIAYELRIKKLTPTAQVSLIQDRAATVDEMELFYAHLTEVMLAIKFLNPQNPGRLEQRIRRLFNRAGLEHREVSILRGILSQMQKNMMSPEP
jgi:tRNA (cytidine32/uridine32-2'-O)-methyltransferase